MAAEKTHPQHSTTESALHSGPRVALHQAIVVIAERELDRALLEHTRPMMGMYVHPSGAEHVAVQRAVRVICSESHRLGLRAEELIIGIKQAWVQLAPVRARQLGDRDGDILREVVSNSIEVFFEARDASTREPLD
jgi:hypothetical protein